MYTKCVCGRGEIGRVLHEATNTVHRPLTAVAKTQEQLYLTFIKIL